MSVIEIILLGIIQGLTEFLPVSSSGHLVVANALLQQLGGSTVDDLVEVNVVLHLGTLAAVLIYYRREIARLLREDRRVVPLLMVGMLPAAVAGLWIKKGLSETHADAILENPLLAGFMFPVTALGLVWAMRRAPGALHYTQLNWRQAFCVGVAQALALLPGISRSGATIAAGLGAGLTRSSAATFAFLLAIPAIGGAGLLEGVEAWKQGATGVSPAILGLGFAVSLVVGLGALALLVRWVERGKLAAFAYYLAPLGFAVVVWQLSS